MQPNFNALYRAIVTSNVDASNKGRIKMQCPQIAGMAEIKFAEPANPSLPIPAVGSTVWAAFSGGDVTKPMYFTNQGAPTIATSTTRPTSPQPGTLVWETDLLSLVVWDGTNWNTIYPNDADAPWISYTPTWSGLTALGSSVPTGKYQVTGHTVNVVATLTAAGTTTIGTGNISVSLPIMAATAPANTVWVGTGRYVPGGGAAWHPLTGMISGNTNIAAVFSMRQTDLAFVNPGVPGLTWAAGSVMNVQLTYEI